MKNYRVNKHGLTNSTYSTMAAKYDHFRTDNGQALTCWLNFTRPTKKNRLQKSAVLRKQQQIGTKEHNKMNKF